MCRGTLWLLVTYVCGILPVKYVNGSIEEGNVNLSITVESGKVAPSKFHFNYVAHKKPVLLQAAMSHAPAMLLWTEEYLRRQLSPSVVSLNSELPKVQGFVSNGSETQPVHISPELHSHVLLPFCLQCPHSHYINMNTVVQWNIEQDENKTHVFDKEILLCLVKGDNNQIIYNTNVTNEPSKDQSNTASGPASNTNQHVTTAVQIEPGDCAFIPSWWNHSFTGNQIAVGFHWSGIPEDKYNQTEDSCHSEFNETLDLASWILSSLKVPKHLSTFWESLRHSKLFEGDSKTAAITFPVSITKLVDKWKSIFKAERDLHEAERTSLNYHFIVLLRSYLDTDQDDFISESEYKVALEAKHDYPDELHQESLVNEMQEILESNGLDIAKILHFKRVILQSVTDRHDKKRNENDRELKRANENSKSVSKHGQEQPHQLPLPDGNLGRLKHYCREFLLAMHRLRLLHEGLFPVNLDNGFAKAWEKASLSNPYLRALFRAKPSVSDFLHVKMSKIFQTLLDMDKDMIVTKEEFNNALDGKFTDNIDFASQLVVIHNFVGTMKHEADLDLLHYMPRHQPSSHDEL